MRKIKHLSPIFLAILITACNMNFDYRQVKLTNPDTSFTCIPSYSDSIITIAAGTGYNKNPIHHFLFGKNYRDVWSVPLKISVLDLGVEAGGMHPVKLGGGKQTISLRVKAKDGKEYNLRSIDKNPEKAVPELFRGTFMRYLVQDQISSSHPYGFLTVYPLARAVKVYHTNPKLVYVPHDPRLGKFLDKAGGMLALMEIHADGDQSDMKRFGYSKNIIKTETLLKKMLKNNEYKVDQRSFLRARLLDMLLGDWDRKDEQYRWAEFKKGAYYYYKPVPEDRDQVYYKKEGLLPALLTGSMLMPYLQSFEGNIKNMQGLNHIAHKSMKGIKYRIDKLFLSGLNKKTWLEIADSMERELTDSIIENAVKRMPEVIYKMTGKEITSKLKSRRNQLKRIAEKYYHILSREIIITGSNKYERFALKQIDNNRIGITIYKTSKTEKKLYYRIFDNNETGDIYICSYQGGDTFFIDGEKVTRSRSKRAGINIHFCGHGQ